MSARVRASAPEMRKNSGDQPKLFTPWMAMDDEPAAAD